MACSLPDRDSMRFIRYFLLSNLVERMFLKKSLLLIIFKPL
jgi:hypothetical protein